MDGPQASHWQCPVVLRTLDGSMPNSFQPRPVMSLIGRRDHQNEQKAEEGCGRQVIYSTECGLWGTKHPHPADSVRSGSTLSLASITSQATPSHQLSETLRGMPGRTSFLIERYSVSRSGWGGSSFCTGKLFGVSFEVRRKLAELQSGLAAWVSLARLVSAMVKPSQVPGNLFDSLARLPEQQIGVQRGQTHHPDIIITYTSGWAECRSRWYTRTTSSWALFSTRV